MKEREPLIKINLSISNSYILIIYRANDCVRVHAIECEPSSANRNCNWRATRYVYIMKGNQKKSFRHWRTFCMSTWWGDCKYMQEIKIPKWLFELLYLQDSTANPAKMAALSCLVLVYPKIAILGTNFLAYF